MRLNNSHLFVVSFFFLSSIVRGNTLQEKRVSLELSLPHSSQDNATWNKILENTNNQNYFLKKFGVETDDESMLWVRSEEKSVELACFNCLVIDSSCERQKVINEDHRSK